MMTEQPNQFLTKEIDTKSSVILNRYQDKHFIQEK